MNYLERTLSSPRWRWLNRLVGPFVWSGHAHNQWMRVVLNRELDRLVAGLNPAALKACEISGRFWDRPNLFREYRALEYPAFDLCDAPHAESFDLVLAEQVFEHLLWPYRAGRNVLAMLNPGGHFLVSTPFLVKVHRYPVDCSRWTETGLKHFLAECGFPLESIVTGSWGNRACVRSNFGPRWTIYQKWRHSLANESDFPIVVWALAKKGPE